MSNLQTTSLTSFKALKKGKIWLPNIAWKLIFAMRFFTHISESFFDARILFLVKNWVYSCIILHTLVLQNVGQNRRKDAEINKSLPKIFFWPHFSLLFSPTRLWSSFYFKIRVPRLKLGLMAHLMRYPKCKNQGQNAKKYQKSTDSVVNLFFH
jgi:hypothetical protein